MRTFVAVKIGNTVKERIQAFIKDLKRFPADVRWIRPEGMHLTLKFLGEVSPGRIEAIGSAMDNLTVRFSAFSIQVIGTGVFPPHPRSPRVIWTGLSETPELMELQKELDRTLENLDFPRETRTFRPHLTLGRVKSPRQLAPLLEHLNKHRQADFGTVSVRALTLFESRLTPEGAEYTQIHSAGLLS
jgi:2'-5' RNA ligase